MLPLGLSLSLFLFFTAAGYCFLSLFYSQRNLVQNMLLAPALGFAFTIILIFLLSWMGLPVKQFGVFLGIILLASMLLCGMVRRPIVPIRRYLSFLAVFILAVLLTGRSMLQFKFNWLSYANDDMANYCLGALRFLNNGYFAIPSLIDLTDGKNYSVYSWFMYAPGMMRSGSELLLAWVSAITGLMPDQVFMPVIMTLHLSLISASCSMIYYSRRWRAPALMLGFLLSVSPLTSLGVLNQLIAQVAGLTLLCAGITVLLRSFPVFRFRTVRYSFLVGILLAAMAIVYPEVAPFLGLPYLIYLLIRYIKLRCWPEKSFFVFLACTAVITLLFLHLYVLHFIAILFVQMTHSGSFTDLSTVLFPYFLVPSGLADLWGLHAIATDTTRFIPAAAIWVAGFLLIVTTVMGVRQFFQGHRVSIVFLIMLILDIVFFKNNNDFALFKLAMYVQPFLLGTLVIGLYQQLRYWYIPLFLLGILNLSAQNVYVDRGKGRQFSAIANVSQFRTNLRLREYLDTLPMSTPLISDAHTIVLAKFQALAAPGRELRFLSRDYFKNLLMFSDSVWTNRMSAWSPRPLNLVSTELQTARNAEIDKRDFDLHDPQQPGLKNSFVSGARALRSMKDPVLLASMPPQTILNRRQWAEYQSQNVKEIPWKEVSNHLVFINSALGEEYHLPDGPNHISLNQLETDYFYRDNTFAGLGRYFLFQILKPSPQFRVLLEMTTTLGPGRGLHLPHAAVIGTQRSFFPLTGRGGARVFSAPIDPQKIDTDSYIGIDMDHQGAQFKEQRNLSMRLYGREVPLDRRRIVGFGRNISIISEADYQALKSPVALKKFPADLADPDLEYSGVYEDGYLSEDAFFVLTQPTHEGLLVIKGKVPLMKDPQFQTELRVLIDDKEVAKKLLTVGDFILHIPHQGAGKHKVSLRFSKLQELEEGDKRPVGISLKLIGF